jgi:hypothetical protein
MVMEYVEGVRFDEYLLQAPPLRGRLHEAKGDLSSRRSSLSESVAIFEALHKSGQLNAPGIEIMNIATQMISLATAN